MNNFEVIIGIEVHLSLNTKTKMFSNALNSHTAIPNTNVSYLDLALPGTLPTINKDAVRKAIWLANDLNMEVDYQNISFDRKNYYYVDLAKGFQITQQYHPIAKNGFIWIKDENGLDKKIEIEKFHLEEDTAKQFTKNNAIYLDFNRAGCPLIEIITKPCINSPTEAVNYLKALRKIALFTDISDAKMEEGSLRADINISLRPYGVEEFGTKIEIKNINSISNVAKAIEFEIQRQSELLLSNKKIISETRRFDDKLDQTIYMRDKLDSVNYRYIYEPNISKISLDDSEYNKFLENKPKSIFTIIKELEKNNFNDNEIQLLTENYHLYKIYEKISSKIDNKKLIFKYLSVELMGLLNKDQLDFSIINDLQINELIKMFDLLIKEEINGKQSKIILEEIYKNRSKIEDIIKKYNMQQIKDEKILLDLILKNIEKNKELCNSYKNRPERVEKTIVGLIMKETNGQANPNITMNILKKELEKL